MTPQAERDHIRLLARRKLDIAHDPVNLERRESWLACHGLAMRRPMVLMEIGGIRDPQRPFMPEPRCTTPAARYLEGQLLWDIWHFEHLRDDYVIEPHVAYNWQVAVTGYGVAEEIHRSPEEGILGAISWDAPIRMDAFEEGFTQLRPRTATVNREATLAFGAELEELVGDILPVRIRGQFFWSQGMTNTLIKLIGLEELMLAMYDAPDELHRMMRFLCDDYQAYNAWLEREGLFSLNNANDYVGSGTRGHVPDLPAPDWREGQPVRTKDLWCLSESQETVGVGPELFGEFIFPYQKEITDTFGLVYYGCCEPVNNRWHILEGMRNIRAVSVSPWCDEPFMAEALERRIVYSRKPSPTLISTGRFDEAAIRADLRHTLHVTAERGCNTEIIMKDVHTLDNNPDRAARWVALAREEIAAAGFTI